MIGYQRLRSIWGFPFWVFPTVTVEVSSKTERLSQRTSIFRWLFTYVTSPFQQWLVRRCASTPTSNCFPPSQPSLWKLCSVLTAHGRGFCLSTIVEDVESLLFGFSGNSMCHVANVVIMCFISTLPTATSARCDISSWALLWVIKNPFSR